jgi:hypothetical protein
MRDELAGVFFPTDTDESYTFREGVVSSDRPTEVDMAGTSGLSASYLDSYSPVIGDPVLIMQTKASLLILGKVNTGGN